MRCWLSRGALSGALAAALLSACGEALGAQQSTARRAERAGRDARSQGDVLEIQRLRETSNAAIARHDTAGIAAILAPQVVVVTSNSAQAIGRDVNAQRFAEQFRARPDVTYRRTPSAVRVFAAWGMASEQGTWTGSWTDSDGKVSLGGSYFAKWRQFDGRWLVESETYVPDRCTGGRYCSTRP